MGIGMAPADLALSAMFFSRRDFLRNGLCGLGYSLLSPHRIADSGKRTGVDDLLLEIKRRACLFFYEQADPATGLVKDRARHTGTDAHTISSIAATGFGLSGMCIAHANGFLKRSDAENRVLKTLDFLANRMPHEHGFFYHFVDMHTAERAFNSEISSIDTALLLLGVLHARAYFDSNPIGRVATEIYERVDWKWMLNGGETLDHGFKPETGFLKSRWDSYSELMAMYLLAIGSPTHPIPASSWQAWTRPMYEYGDLRYISAPAPLFIHESAHAWVDFRHQRDAFANYFENSRLATLAHKRFCLTLREKYPWYSNELWGITADRKSTRLNSSHAN